MPTEISFSLSTFVILVEGKWHYFWSLKQGFFVSKGNDDMNKVHWKIRLPHSEMYSKTMGEFTFWMFIHIYWVCIYLAKYFPIHYLGYYIPLFSRHGSIHLQCVLKGRGSHVYRKWRLLWTSTLSQRQIHKEQMGKYIVNKSTRFPLTFHSSLWKITLKLHLDTIKNIIIINILLCTYAQIISFEYIIIVIIYFFYSIILVLYTQTVSRECLDFNQNMLEMGI